MHEDRVVRLLHPLDETAKQLSIGRTTVYALIQAGELERVKIGRRTLVPAESIAAYIDRLRADEAPCSTEGP